MAVLIIAIVFVVLICMWPGHRRLSRRQERLDGPDGPVLLVIAHPDDECMFFGPALTALRGAVHVLCLSSGNPVPAISRRRKNELSVSCRVLGVMSVEVVDSPSLIDGHFSDWPADVIRAKVSARLSELRISKILTFDERGVSGHPNHIAIATALAHPSIKQLAEVWQLRSSGILQKYIPLLDRAFMLLGIEGWRVRASNRDVSAIQRAFQRHASQQTWYRSLYLVFSRYIYVNEFTISARANEPFVHARGVGPSEAAAALHRASAGARH